MKKLHQFHQQLVIIFVLLLLVNFLLFSIFVGFTERFIVIPTGIVEKLVGIQESTLIRYASSSNSQPTDGQTKEQTFNYLDRHNLWTVAGETRQLFGVHVKTLFSQASHQSVQVSEPTLWPQKTPKLVSYANKQSQYSVNQPQVSYDRIIEQLIYQPEWLRNKGSGEKPTSYDADRILKIKPDLYDLDSGQDIFFQEACLVDKCEITYDWSEADAIIFKNFNVEFIPYEYRRTEEQVWIAYLLESPSNVYKERYYREERRKHLFNWTATYRHDSDIVTPYEKFVPYAETIDQYLLLGNLSYKDKQYYYDMASDESKKLIQNKTKNVVWFVSNCYTTNSREKYVKSLSAYIDIDIYGRCGNKNCEKSHHGKCLRMANAEYRFYIAFENSKDQDYITEKFYNNGLGKNNLHHLMVPIVMGTSKGDYLRQAPSHSFIHVDDFDGPQQLAGFLKIIANNNVLFHSYFIWKSMGKFIDTKFYCRVCTMLHYTRKNGITKYYNDVYEWFRQPESHSEIYTNNEYDNHSGTSHQMNLM